MAGAGTGRDRLRVAGDPGIRPQCGVLVVAEQPVERGLSFPRGRRARPGRGHARGSGRASGSGPRRAPAAGCGRPAPAAAGRRPPGRCPPGPRQRRRRSRGRGPGPGSGRGAAGRHGGSGRTGRKRAARSRSPSRNGSSLPCVARSFPGQVRQASTRAGCAAAPRRSAPPAAGPAQPGDLGRARVSAATRPGPATVPAARSLPVPADVQRHDLGVVEGLELRRLVTSTRHPASPGSGAGPGPRRRRCPGRSASWYRPAAHGRARHAPRVRGICRRRDAEGAQERLKGLVCGAGGGPGYSRAGR